MQLIPMTAKLNQLLQSSVSHDPLEIILICLFDAQETFIIINVENSFAADIFMEIIIHCFQDS